MSSNDLTISTFSHELFYRSHLTFIEGFDSHDIIDQLILMATSVRIISY